MRAPVLHGGNLDWKFIHNIFTISFLEAKLVEVAASAARRQPGGMNMSVSRRDFLKTTAVGAAAATALTGVASVAVADVE